MSKQLPLLAGSLTALTLCGTAFAQTFQLDPLWSLAPGDRSYLTTDNTTRGMTYNPVTGHVLVASRAGGLSVNVLSAANGSHLGTLDMTGIPTSGGGTFSLSMIGAGSDGAIYGANLTVNGSTDPFRLYRWANEAAAPAQVYSGNPNSAGTERWGDNIAVRGAGNNTQVLLGSRSHTTAALFLTANGGASFGANVITTDAVAGDFGLTVAYGSGNDFWGTASGRTLRHIDVNPLTAVGTTVGNFGAAEGVPTSLITLGIEPTQKLLVGVDLVTGADKVYLYDIATGTPVLLDTEILPTDVANGNGTGSIAFGGGNVYVMDSNNGLVAYAITPVPEPHEYALVAGLGLLGFAAYRRWHLKQA